LSLATHIPFSVWAAEDEQTVATAIVLLLEAQEAEGG
jgi:hypothetical protein